MTKMSFLISCVNRSLHIAYIKASSLIRNNYPALIGRSHGPVHGELFTSQELTFNASSQNTRTRTRAHTPTHRNMYTIHNPVPSDLLETHCHTQACGAGGGEQAGTFSPGSCVWISDLNPKVKDGLQRQRVSGVWFQGLLGVWIPFPGARLPAHGRAIRARPVACRAPAPGRRCALGAVIFLRRFGCIRGK